MRVPSMRFAKWAGIVVQAIVLGGLLFLAVMKMIAIQSGARVFQYQGF